MPLLSDLRVGREMGLLMWWHKMVLAELQERAGIMNKGIETPMHGC